MNYVQTTMPENNWKLFSRAIRLYRAGFNKTIGAAFLISIIAFLPRIIDFIKGRNVLEVIPLVKENDWLFLMNVACLVFFIFILERFEFLIEKKKDKVKQDFFLSLKKLPFVFLAAVVQTLVFLCISLSFVGLFVLLKKLNLVYTTDPRAMALVVAPFFLMICLGVYLSVAFFFYVPLIVTENAHILQSLLRSCRLVWGNWWRTVLLQLTPWVSYLCVLWLLRYGVDIDLHMYYEPFAATNLLAMLVHMLVFALFIPLFASTMLVQLHDLEMRRKPQVKLPKHTKPKRIAKKKKS